MSVTFHKAFDLTRDPDEALDALVALGIDRVLSSGCQPTAVEGVHTLRRMVERARGKITIMAGGRLTIDNLAMVLSRTGVHEVHLGSAVTRVVETAMARGTTDASGQAWCKVDPARVQTIVDLVASIDCGTNEYMNL